MIRTNSIGKRLPGLSERHGKAPGTSEDNLNSGAMPVDIAISDGGWMLLNSEWWLESNHLGRHRGDIIVADYPEFA
jgi:hypothetical protein